MTSLFRVLCRTSLLLVPSGQDGILPYSQPVYGRANERSDGDAAGRVGGDAEMGRIGGDFRLGRGKLVIW